MEIKRTRRQTQFLKKYGSWAVVTGASEGIGYELSVALAQQGFNLILVARRQKLLEQMASQFSEGYGIQTRVLPLDLGQEESLTQVVDGTQDLEVGLFVAAAGFGTSGNFLKSDLAAEVNMIHVNCRAVTALTHHFARRFADQKRGGLILLSSLLAFQGVPFAAHYAATKSYIQTFAEGLKVELAPYGVDVLAAAPGPVLTGFAKRANMQMGFGLEPKSVAHSTLSALGRKTTVRPGWLSLFLEWSLKPLNRWGRTRMLKIVMGGMTKHQRA